MTDIDQEDAFKNRNEIPKFEQKKTEIVCSTMKWYYMWKCYNSVNTRGLAKVCSVQKRDL